MVESSLQTKSRQVGKLVLALNFILTTFYLSESDGLVGVVDINDRNKTYLPTEAVFNATGDSLLISDSRN